MPKQTYKINKFEGGLNRQSDPRDINDNELSIAHGINVDTLGIIGLGGGQALPTHGPKLYGDGSQGVPFENVQDEQAGYGLTHFSSDYN